MHEINEDIQDKTVDKGWASMKALLDQEMPADEKRRRFVWWWFAFLLLPLVAVGGWYWGIGRASDEAPVEQPKQSSDMPFAAAQPTRAAGEPVVAAPENTPENPLHTGEKTPVQAYIQKQHTTSSGISAKYAGQAPAVTDSQAKTSNTLTELPAAFKSQIPDPTTQTPEKSTVLVLPVVKINGFDLLPVSAALVESQLSPSNPTPVSVDAAPVENTITPAKKRDTWALGPSAILGTERFSAANTLGAGLAVQWQPKRRWGLRSGLNYVQYSPSEKSQPVASVNYARYSEALNSGYEISDLAGNTLPVSGGYPGQADAVIIPITRLNMIEMPILVAYNLAGRVKVFGGITSSYVLNAKARKESYAANYKFKANTDPNIENLNDLATANAARWRFDFQTGAGIGLGRHWELGFFTKLPLQQLSGANKTVVSNGGANFLDTFGATINVRNRLPMTFALQANYYLFRR